jgi:outer membrane protein assembly factor BamB
VDPREGSFLIPIGSDGSVYWVRRKPGIGGLAVAIMAISSDGTTKWTWDSGDKVKHQSAVLGALVDARDTLYVLWNCIFWNGDNGAMLYAFSSEGQKLWDLVLDNHKEVNNCSYLAMAMDGTTYISGLRTGGLVAIGDATPRKTLPRKRP